MESAIRDKTKIVFFIRVYLLLTILNKSMNIKFQILNMNQEQQISSFIENSIGKSTAQIQKNLQQTTFKLFNRYKAQYQYELKDLAYDISNIFSQFSFYSSIIESILVDFIPCAKLGLIQKSINKCINSIISFLKSQLSSRKDLITDRVKDNDINSQKLSIICKRCQSYLLQVNVEETKLHLGVGQFKDFYNFFAIGESEIPLAKFGKDKDCDNYFYSQIWKNKKNLEEKLLEIEVQLQKKKYGLQYSIKDYEATYKQLEDQLLQKKIEIKEENRYTPSQNFDKNLNILINSIYEKIKEIQRLQREKLQKHQEVQTDNEDDILANPELEKVMKKYKELAASISEKNKEIHVYKSKIRQRDKAIESQKLQTNSMKKMLETTMAEKYSLQTELEVKISDNRFLKQKLSSLTKNIDKKENQIEWRKSGKFGKKVLAQKQSLNFSQNSLNNSKKQIQEKVQIKEGSEKEDQEGSQSSEEVFQKKSFQLMKKSGKLKKKQVFPLNGFQKKNQRVITFSKKTIQQSEMSANDISSTSKLSEYQSKKKFSDHLQSKEISASVSQKKQENSEENDIDEEFQNQLQKSLLQIKSLHEMEEKQSYSQRENIDQSWKRSIKDLINDEEFELEEDYEEEQYDEKEKDEEREQKSTVKWKDEFEERPKNELKNKKTDKTREKLKQKQSSRKQIRKQGKKQIQKQSRKENVRENKKQMTQKQQKIKLNEKKSKTQNHFRKQTIDDKPLTSNKKISNKGQKSLSKKQLNDQSELIIGSMKQLKQPSVSLTKNGKPRKTVGNLIKNPKNSMENSQSESKKQFSYSHISLVSSSKKIDQKQEVSKRMIEPERKEAIEKNKVALDKNCWMALYLQILRDKRIDIGYRNFKKETEEFINGLISKKKIEIQEKGKMLKTKQLPSREICLPKNFKAADYFESKADRRQQYKNKINQILESKNGSKQKTSLLNSIPLEKSNSTHHLAFSQKLKNRNFYSRTIQNKSNLSEPITQVRKSPSFHCDKVLLDLFFSVEEAIKFQKNKSKTKIANALLTLERHEHNYYKKVMAKIAELHVMNHEAYEKLKNLIISPYSSIVSDSCLMQVKKSQSFNHQLKDSLQEIIIYHRKKCKKSNEICKHLNSFLVKLSQMI